MQEEGAEEELEPDNIVVGSVRIKKTNQFNSWEPLKELESISCPTEKVSTLNTI